MKRVYIIDFGNMIKVGVSGNIEKRLRSLPVKGEKRFYCTSMIENAFELEHRMHSLLGKYRVSCKSREYFNYDFNKSVEILEKQLNADCVNHCEDNSRPKNEIMSDRAIDTLKKFKEIFPSLTDEKKHYLIGAIAIASQY